MDNQTIPNNISSCLLFYAGTDGTNSPYITMVTVYFYVAIFLTLTLLFLTKRKNACLGCLNGYFGIASPGNLLTSRRHRWAYVLAFGITIETITNIIFNPDQVPLAYPLALIDWDSFSMGWITRKILAINFYMIYYYPMFVSITMQTFWGYLIGIVQIIGLMIIKIYSLAACAGDANIAVLILVGLTTLICQAAMIIYFLAKIVYFFRNGGPQHNKHKNWMKPEYEASYILHENYPELHVKSLFTPKEKRNENLILKFYKLKAGFLYSGRVLTSSALAILIIYQITVIICAGTIPDMIDSANNFSDETSALFAMVTLLFTIFKGEQPTNSDAGTLVGLVQGFLDGAWISLVVCVVISLLFAIFNAFFQIVVYRRNIRELYKGKKTNLNTKQLASSGAITSTLKYGAYCIAYQVWAYIFFVVVLYLCCLIIILIVWMPAQLGNHWLRKLLIDCIPGWIYTVVIIVLQSVLANYVFLADNKVYKEKKPTDDYQPQAPMWLTNLRVYDFTVYIFWFNNLFVGLFSLLMRLVYAMCVSLVFLARLDQPAVQRYWETLDAGYNCYLGFLATEVANNHPVMICFVQLLLGNKKFEENWISGEVNEAMEEKSETIRTDVDKKKRIRTRWHLLYTLHKNPELRFLRKHYLPKKVEIEEKIEESIFSKLSKCCKKPSNDNKIESSEIQF